MSDNNSLWLKIDELKKQRKEGLEVIEMCYGALKGLTFGEYEGKGGASKCIADACLQAQRYLQKGKITDRDIVRRSKRRVVEQGGKWLTSQEVCTEMDISDSSLRRLVREGKPHPPFIKIHSAYRFPHLHFKEWTKKNLINSKGKK